LNTAESVIHSAKSCASKYESVLMIDNNKQYFAKTRLCSS